MKIYNNITELIGNTPLLMLSRYAEERKLGARICAKLEYFNPAGSSKDRVGKALIEDAEARGLLKPGAAIIEPTSGNTGIGLAAYACVKGYRVILTMPDTMSMERRKLLKAYGAEIVLTDGSLGMAGAIEEARRLSDSIPGSFIPGQFDNPANCAAHYNSTGPEIWKDTDGQVDIFVASVGTGGTITGVAEYLKSKKPSVKIVAVEPAGSPVISGGKPGLHKIQGIGAGFIPSILNTSLIDEVIAVNDEDAMETSRALAHNEGLLAGISSGAAVYAASVLAERPENHGKLICVLLPDSGERYLSTELFV